MGLWFLFLERFRVWGCEIYKGFPRFMNYSRLFVWVPVALRGLGFRVGLRASGLGFRV